MDELLEYKKLFLNYPRTSIKEMASLLQNSLKDDFIKAYMHNIFLLSYKLYKMFPSYFEFNSIMDLIQDGNEIAVKIYNSGIRDYDSFTFRIYYLFYVNTMHKIKVNLIVRDKYQEFLDEFGRAPSSRELEKITGFHRWDIGKQKALPIFVSNDSSSVRYEDCIIEKIEKEEIYKYLKSVIDSFSPDEKDLYIKRYEEGLSLRAIGALYDKSFECIRKRDNKIKKLVNVDYINKLQS